ncbi:unnamed protein product [Urochloa decumbens]|uniref:E2 ubiquitin-conjugating enzyme n=1 Tax=Urochloa decumbens TaxID=240449 RepID=A0ABC8VXG3_9POAL
MEDAMGQTIRWRDLVVFKPSAGAHCDRGLVLKRKPGPNKVAVQRLDGAEVTLNAGDVVVVDRSYLRAGMAVASASPDLAGGQVGVVTDATTALDVVRLDGGAGEEEHAPAAVVIATAVPPGDLRRVREFCLGDYVVSGPWLGRVFEVSLDVDVMFGDGGAAVCWVARAGSRLWTLNKDSLNRHTNSVFYPGQRVSGRHGRRARLLPPASSASPAPPPPPHQQSPRDLTFFCSGETNYGFWSVGDRCFFRAPAAGDVPRRDRATRTTRHWNRHRRKPPLVGAMRDRRHAAELELELEQTMCVVAGTRTAVDVVWQDGTRQRGVPSVSLVPFVARREHDFFPGERVVVAVDAHGGGAGGMGDPDSLEARVGVVESLSYKDQTVRVSWFKAAERAGEIDCHETLSAYDLRRRNSCRDPFYGDIVVRRSAIGDDASGSTDQEPVPAYGNKDATAAAANDLSWVGHIVDLCCDDAHVQVKWRDGNTSKVLLREIAVVKHQCVGDMLREIGDWVHEDGDTNNANDRSKPQETAAIINNGNDGQGDDDSGSESDDEDGHAAMRRPAGWGQAEADATSDDKSLSFSRFDVVQSPLDHHYLDNMERWGRKWTKRVQKEWKILENNLPDAIYVRAYEDRMDLLRVVMVGASGTPYHDGLFFFDLQLPPSYPAAPPLVNYRSFGLRVNPNLYPSGTVCLSLLNIFGGQGTEVWSPEASSVLQVVVSIQGLVLNAQPYYNEAGYAAQAGTPVGRRNELPYSENAYLLTLQTMLHLLRRPPAGFEDFVRDHFRRRGQHVLRACEAYLDGSPVGTLDAEARAMEGMSKERQPCSAGFKLALQNVMPRLVEAFAGIGAQGRAEPERTPKCYSQLHK